MKERRISCLPSDILEKGWIQFVLGNGTNTTFCLVGAIIKSGGTYEKRLRLAVVEEILATGWKPKNPDRTYMSTWNDERARTQAEVVALVRRAEIACGLRPEDNPEQWNIPVEPAGEVEPVLAETV